MNIGMGLMEWSRGGTGESRVRRSSGIGGIGAELGKVAGKGQGH